MSIGIPVSVLYSAIFLAGSMGRSVPSYAEIMKVFLAGMAIAILRRCCPAHFFSPPFWYHSYLFEIDYCHSAVAPFLLYFLTVLIKLAFFSPGKLRLLPGPGGPCFVYDAFNSDRLLLSLELAIKMLAVHY